MYSVIQGRIDRWPFFWWGCALMAIKYNLDRAIAWFGFHRTWYFWNYIKPHGFAGIVEIPPDDQSYYLVLLLTSLPFLVFGIILTLRRLRSADLPLALCLFFFVPIFNLIFFAILCLIPAREALLQERGNLGRLAWLPRSAVGSALASIVIVGVTGLVLAYFSTLVLRNYGWGLFVALPFAMGLVSVLIYAGNQKRGFLSCVLVSLLPIFLVGLLLFALAAEGAICLLMAAPIGFGLAFLGGIVGYIIVANRSYGLSPSAMLLVLISVPFTMGMEEASDKAPPLLSVTTSVIIDAPPAEVWPNVVTFSHIPEQRDWVLHTGVAYPTQARIDGHGVGAIRHCIFTTGEFVEPIQVWDEPQLLRFSVAAQPEPMEELSPYPRLRTPHLHGYLQSQEGELRLTALSSNRTLLEGTTWYTDRIWPSQYWQVWSDLVIHHIHLRVLNHIKALSEVPNTQTSER